MANDSVPLCLQSSKTLAQKSLRFVWYNKILDFYITSIFIVVAGAFISRIPVTGRWTTTSVDPKDAQASFGNEARHFS